MMVTFDDLVAGRDRIGIVGLGYVGLPLAVHLSMHFKVTGYDPKASRIQTLQTGQDTTLEVTAEELARARIDYSTDASALADCRLIIVAVPTPIDTYHIPNLEPVKNSAAAVGRHLQKGACVVYESTVYPGVTEEVCRPIIEDSSGLVFGRDFTLGYSPERINPGDKVHTLDNIVKVVSGSDAATQDLLAAVYGRVVKAGVHLASSIKVAEAAKVIENTQRDLNIALMNELAMIFDKIGIDTLEVLKAAGSKWNFLPFRPGLVGGHCIGVDPYYLTFKAESLGYHPEMILAGRRINDSMGKYVAERVVKSLIKAQKPVHGTKVAVLGVTFKENVPDIRNTKVVDIIRELADYGINVVTHDPLADADEAKAYYGIELSPMDALANSAAVVLAVPHRQYLDLGIERIAALADGIPLVLDVKGVLDREKARNQNMVYWRL